MTLEEARRELKAAVTRAHWARKKTVTGFGTDPGMVVMVTEEVAATLLADLRETTDLSAVISIIEGWESDAAMSVYGVDGEIYNAEARAYEKVLDLLRGVS